MTPPDAVDPVARMMIEKHEKRCEKKDAAFLAEIRHRFDEIWQVIDDHRKWRMKILLMLVMGLLTLSAGLIGYLWITMVPGAAKVAGLLTTHG